MADTVPAVVVPVVSAVVPTPAPQDKVPGKFLGTLLSRKFQIAAGTVVMALGSQLQSGAPWSPVVVLQIFSPLLMWMVLEGLADAAERALPAAAPLIEMAKAWLVAVMPVPGQSPAPAPAPVQPAPVVINVPEPTAAAIDMSAQLNAQQAQLKLLHDRLGALQASVVMAGLAPAAPAPATKPEGS